jgi:hypothetical protein
MGQTIEQQVLARVYGHGRGWVFSPKDFLHIGNRKAVDVTLIRLTNAGTIRRIIRGIYDYPRFSELLSQQLGPDMHQVALALSRKFGWTIQPGSAAALNLIGLSTQVPSQYAYLSDGPDRTYRIDKTVLKFEKTALKETRFRMEETGIVVQAIKALGHPGITPDVRITIRKWLGQDKLPKVLKDAGRITDWVYEEIKRICKEGTDG